MIQRIQTVFLALAGLSGFSLFLKPMDFALLNGAGKSQEVQAMLADGIFDVHDHISLTVLAVLLGFVPIVSIFLFKNRKLQMSLDRFAVLVGLALLIVGGYFFYQAYEPVQSVVQAQAGFGLAAPILSFIFLFMANRAISKDEKLVRSADRLR